MDDEEEEIGVRCIGAPVWDWDGRVIAAVSVAGPTTRINEDTFDTLVSDVRRTALAISQQLGALAGHRTVQSESFALHP
jgi:IclR family transcriptional regulator, KDG regulon repressor